MEEHFDIFSKLIKRRKPDLPENFFTNFQSNFIQNLSNLDESEDFVLPKTKTPEVPAEFFKNFHANLQAEIEGESAFAELKLKKTAKPTVPLNFESEFTESLMKKIRQKPSKGRILKITFWSTAAAVAAGFTLLFTINPEPVTNQPETLTETNFELSEEESLDTYVAYLDEEALVDYIIENDIDMGQTESESDEVYDYVSGDIEDIYLDL
ncbi:MAG: hypothetical protein IPH24_01065 [Crocinitomicaceae bacterium]|nr:hypothetical protein [Crocinitomicaceae bacterium]